jgi:hypothetical protein
MAARLFSAEMRPANARQRCMVVSPVHGTNDHIRSSVPLGRLCGQETMFGTFFAGSLLRSALVLHSSPSKTQEVVLSQQALS